MNKQLWPNKIKKPILHRSKSYFISTAIITEFSNLNVLPFFPLLFLCELEQSCSISSG